MFRNRKRVWWNLAAFLVSLVLFVVGSQHLLGYLDIEKVATRLEQKIDSEIRVVDEFLEEEQSRKSLMTFAEKVPYRNFFIIRNDSVVFYTSNQIILDDSCISQASENNVAVINTANQTILSKSYQYQGDSTVIHVISLRNDYEFTNRFLNNSFVIDEEIPTGVQLTAESQMQNIHVDGLKVGVAEGHPLQWSKSQSRAAFLLFLVPWIMLFVMMYVFYQEFAYFNTRPGLRLLAFSVDMAIVAFIILFFKIPGFVFDLYLFENGIFVFPGLFYGLGNAVLIFVPVTFFAWAFYNWLPQPQMQHNWHFIPAALLVILSVSSLFFSYMLVKYLIFNSGFTIEISEPVHLNVDSAFGLLLLVSAIISTLLVSTRALLFVTQRWNNKSRRWLIIGLGAVFILAAAILVNWYYLFLLLQYSVIVAFILMPNLRLNVYFILTLLLVSAIGYSVIIENLYYEKQAKELELRAMRILNNRDRIFEARFSDIRQQILDDASLMQKVEKLDIINADDSDIRKQLRQKHFAAIESKYDVSVTLCDTTTELLVNYDDDPVSCMRYFEEVIDDVGKKSLAEGLYFIDDGDKVRKYLAQIELTNDVFLFADIYQKNTPFAQGYPELLVTEAAGSEWLSGYDYGIYRNKSLLSSYGDFNYPLTLNMEFLEEQQEYRHYTFSENGKTLIISVRESALTNALAGTSYLFLMLGLMFFLMYFFIHQRLDVSVFSRFRSRLQASIFTILLLTFIIIGYFVFTHIGHQNNQKNVTNLKELSHSILIELEHKFSGLDNLKGAPLDYTYEQLIKFSNVFFSDINLYDVEGNLVASSRQQVFDRNIISERINTTAYHKLRNQHLNMFIQRENIGEYRFLSSYFPLRNYNNEVIAYVNLPYFARQRKLTEEISLFLTTFINIYVILTVVSLFLIWIISNYITKPMETIKRSLSQTELSKSNVKIDIHRNDEIGDLVREYNKMVDELEKSARKLVATERETAWREMAKQVAHEIKNPLTPMKLSVQHLGRVLNFEKAENNEALDRFARNMIDQIESLSEIATAFSDFAKMPSVELKKTDINRVIENTLELFRGTENITFYHDAPSSCYIKGDEKQLQRVFINLLKNAVQALHHKQQGFVRIRVNKENGFVKVFIEDNGSGIKEDQINKIFLPNFTTKSGGTGLGLAMVRNIVNNFGGTIALLSTSEEGTVFYLEIPEYEENGDV